MTDFGVCSYRLDLEEPGVLEEILHTYSQPLIRYAYSLIGSTAAAEDAMEDAIAALFVKGGSFSSPEALRAWLYRTTRNKAVSYVRRHSREVPLQDVEQVLSTVDAEENMLLRLRNRQLYACLQDLPRQYRDVLVLYYFDGFDVPGICAVWRKSPKQVYNMLARARDALRQRLIKEGISYEDLR